MLKILIVDDEYLVRMGLCETINWHKYGFEIVAEASDGEDGYLKYLEFSPDVIITDIRMGDTSGLDLVEKVHAHNKDAEMVILSGYGQFDYAKKAYENGACAFLSKPLDNDELIGVMLNIKEKIENRLDINHRLDTLSSHIPYLRNTFITGLLEGKIQNKTVMKNKCNEYEIPIPHGNYIVVSFCIDNIPSLPNSVLEKLNELMTETIDCAINTYNFNAFYANTSPGNIGMVIIREKEHLNVDNFTTKDLLFYIQKEFASVSDNTLTIGLSKNHTDNSELSTAYNESKIALTHKSHMGNNTCIDYSIIANHKTATIFLPNKDINLIIKSVKDADYKNTMLVVDKFFSQVYEKENVDIKSLKNIVSEMMVMVMRSIFKSSQTSINIFGRDVQPYAELQNMETILQIETFVKDFFNKLFEDPNLYLEYTYHPEIQQAINIIMKNYMKPLTVEAVANELLISQYYLMHLFKKEVGKTFNEFLTRRRIDVSIELLMTNKYKIHEICDMIGYKNTNYFAKIFKQLVGVSPKNYVKQSTYCKEN